MSGLHELSVTRLIAASPAVVYRVWTTRTAEWFVPKPWRVEIVAQELRAGGRSAMLVRGPNGEEAPNEGIFLEVVPNERIVVTDAFATGWLPRPAFFVGLFAFAPEGAGTRYTATARHWDEETMKRHEAMGFHPGWDIVADQLAALSEGEAP